MCDSTIVFIDGTKFNKYVTVVSTVSGAILCAFPTKGEPHAVEAIERIGINPLAIYGDRALSLRRKVLF